MTPPITLTVGSRALTSVYSDLNWSNVDPGGFEQLTATVTDPSGLKVGDEVTVRCGLETAWHGRLNEIGDRSKGRAAKTQIAALGYGVKLTDKRVQMVYADRDLARWGGAGTTRRANLLAAGTGQVLDPTVTTDQSAPGLRTAFRGAWPAGQIPVCEAWYDAGPGCLISLVGGTWTRGQNVGTVDTNWVWTLLLATDDVASSTDGTGDLQAAGPSAVTLAATTSRRFAVIQFYYATGPAGLDGYEFNVDWKDVVVYGNHGLTKRGAVPQGFYPGDIVGHALTNSGAGFELVADDSSGLIVGHAVYRDPVPHEQVLSEMAKLMGWHYGTWEPRTILDTTPRLFFVAPPPVVTCVAARSDFGEDFDAPKVRVDRLYDTAKVRWTDAAGSTGITTVTISNPLAASAGVTGRVLDLDMGLGDATTATTYGAYALALALNSARGGGSGTLSGDIRLPGGGSKPACLLKAGRDRIRILDLPDSGSLTETDANRQDSFLVRRVEPSVRNGEPVTRIEFDGGADLLEVLQARLALAASIPSGVPGSD